MCSFRDIIDGWNWYRAQSRMLEQTRADVRRSLDKQEPRDLYDFMALVSPAAEEAVDEMAVISRSMTEIRFGRRIALYVPLYLSSHCHNSCVYCGYRRENPIERTVLTEEEIERELRSIRSHGFDHVLLVTGDHPKVAGIEYVAKALAIAGQSFGAVSLEVQPLRVGEYAALRAQGLHSVYVYQETYNRTRYRSYHPKGMKSHFYHRLETPDRIARAGVGRVGLGVLLGLEDWRTDSFFAALHAAYLLEAYPGLRVSLSFPRLRPAEGGVRPNVTLSDRQLIQLICAYRLCFPEMEMALSTRESSEFRDRAVSLGITSMSAGSRTSPGGYATRAHALEQFEICDIRSAEDVAEMIVAQGYEPVWSERALVSRPHPSFV